MFCNGLTSCYLKRWWPCEVSCQERIRTNDIHCGTYSPCLFILHNVLLLSFRLLHYSHSGIDYIDCGRSIMAQWMGANTKRRHGRSNHHDLLLAHMKYLLLVFQLVWLIKKINKKETGVMGCAKHRNNPFWILQSNRYWRRCEEESITYSIQQFTQVCFSMKYIILLATVRFT